MQKELDPMRQLETRRNRLSSVLEEGNAVIGRRETNAVKLKEEVGTSFEATLKYGRHNRGTGIVRRTVTGLQGRLEKLDQELDAIVQEQAQSYLADVNLKRSQLAVMSEMVAEGNLTPDDLLKHQQQFEELVKLPKSNPLLQIGLEKLRQEEARKEKETKPPEVEASSKGEAPKAGEIEELEPGMFRLPDGKPVRLSEKEQKYLQLIPINKDEAIPSSVPANGIYEEELKKGKIELRVALSRAKALRRNLNIRKLNPAGWEIKNAAPLIYITGKKGIVEAQLYLASIQKEDQPEQSVEPVKPEGFQFEDGEIITGEQGKLLNKLSPFSNEHIVARQELLNELGSDDAQVNEETLNQHLEQTRTTLLANRHRLAELPNLKVPENVGYYVEPYRPPVRISLLGDTIRFRDAQNQDREIRLSERQYRLLWELAKGEPKLDTQLVSAVSDVSFQDESFFFGNLELVKTVADSLNKNLTELTSVDGIIASVGDENFGHWHKIKDANISRRIMHFPLRASRQDALRLIFQEDPATTKQDVINSLGPTSGRRLSPYMLTESQAWRALRGAIYSLKYRNIENITTEDEANLYRQMQEYKDKHNLVDEKKLVDYIANRLGFAQRSSTVDLVEDAEGAVVLETEDLQGSGEEAIGKVDAFIQELPDETRALFAEVRESGDFGYASDIARSFVRQDPRSAEELAPRIAGYLFETLAYLHLRKKFSEQNQILLSPQETFEIYSILFPQNRETSNGYGLQKSIDGISVPDGILLAPLKNGNRGIRVDGVLEYRLGIRDDSETTDKLTRYQSRFEESMSPLRNSRSYESNMVRGYLRSRHQNFPRNISVNQKTDAFLALPLDAKMLETLPSGIKKIPIPVSSVTFGHFVNALMGDAEGKK